MVTRRIALGLAVLLTILIFAALVYLAPQMQPVPKGNSRDFWFNALAVILDDRPVTLRGAAIRYGNQWIYCKQGLHCIYCYSITDAEIQVDWARVEAQLAAAAEKPETPENILGNAYHRWKSLKVPDNESIEQLILCLDEAVVYRVRESQYTPMSHGWMEQTAEIRRVARAAEYYWASFMFEFLWLSGLVWLALWPLISGWRTRWFYTCLAIAFVLLYVPHWFGYCVLSRIPWGPTGGILYSWFIWYSGWPWVYCWWDHHFLVGIPPLLSAINQGMAVTFRDFDDYRNYFEFHGPTDVVLRCLALLAGVGAVHWFVLHIELKPSQKSDPAKLADGNVDAK